MNWLFNNKHRGKRLQRCQQGRPSTFVPINVHSYLWRMYCVTLYSCWECTHFVEIKYVQWNLWNTKVSEHIVKDNNSSSLSWSWYVLWHGVRRNRTQNLYTPRNIGNKEREEYTCTIGGNCEHWWVQKGEGRPCWHLCNLFPLW